MPSLGGVGTGTTLTGVSVAPKNESEKERRRRLESLVSQYTSNLPKIPGY